MGLELRNATKHYGDLRALDDVSFTVEAGRILGFLGPNGAGKTTAMRAVFGLVRLDRGEVAWNGVRLKPDQLLRFGYMPETRGLYPKMTVRDQLVYLAQLHGLSSREAAEATDRWLEELGVLDRGDHKVETLSHGNQQKVQLAAALVHDPEVLVLDEPFSGLDPIGVETMEDIIRSRAAEGATVLFSSHQLDLVEGLVDDVVVISKGRVVLEGAIDEVRERTTFRRLDVEVESSNGSWSPNVDGVEVTARQNGLVRLQVGPDVDLEAVLKSANDAGRVTRFSYQPPSLSEIFVKAVQG